MSPSHIEVELVAMKTRSLESSHSSSPSQEARPDCSLAANVSWLPLEHADRMYADFNLVYKLTWAEMPTQSTRGLPFESRKFNTTVPGVGDLYL